MCDFLKLPVLINGSRKLNISLLVNGFLQLKHQRRSIFNVSCSAPCSFPPLPRTLTETKYDFSLLIGPAVPGRLALYGLGADGRPVLPPEMCRN